MRTLAGIIKARTETILEQVDFEIKQSHLEKEIFAGIVLTGGGAQLRHIKDLTEYITGIDTRIGLPNEHLDRDTDNEIINTMYATGIGLVLYGFDELDKYRQQLEEDDNQNTHAEPDNTHETSIPKDNANDIFADMPTANESTTQKPLDDIEREMPATPKTEPADTTPDVSRRRPRKPGWGSQAMKAIDKYFGRVFGDDTIRNEGKDEKDI
jgi:cell division ATPase FtsA